MCVCVLDMVQEMGCRRGIRLAISLSLQWMEMFSRKVDVTECKMQWLHIVRCLFVDNNCLV